MNITNKPNITVEQSQRVGNTNSQAELQEQKPNQETLKASQSNNQVSDLSKAIDSTFNSLAEQSDVDMDKVAQVKAAIANGEFKLDEATLIDALLEMHKK